MAGLTAKLDADFSAFFTACTNAVRSLTSLAEAGKGTEASLTAVDSSIGKIALGMVGATSAMSLVEKGIDFLKESFQSFAEAEANVRHLTAALELNGTATTDVIGQFRDLAEQYQQTTIYSDSMITSAEKTFTMIGKVAPEQMGNAIKAATNLASGLGIDLQTAVNMLSKAAEGNVTALHKVGVEIDAAAVKAHGAEAAFDAVNAKFSGQAQADMETTAGHIAQMSNAWDAFKEKVGGVIADLGSVANALGDGKNVLGDTIPKIDGATYALKQQDAELPNATKGWVAYLTTIAHYGSYLDPTKLAQEITEGMKQIDDVLAKGAPTAPQFQIPKPDWDGLINGAKSYTTELALANEKYHQLTPDVIANLDAAFKLGTASVADLTAQTGLSADVIGVAKKAWEAHNEELKKGEDAARKFAEAQAAIAAAYVPLTAQQKAAAVANDAVGLSAEQTAKAFGISGGAVKAYLDGLKATQAQAEAFAKMQVQWADDTRNITEKATANFQKEQTKQAEASAKTLSDDLAAYTDYSDKVAQLSMTGTQIQIDNIDKAQQKEIDSLGIRTATNAKMYDDATAVIDTYYNHERDLANQTADTIEERMRQQGVFTENDLADQAFAAAQAYNQMVADGGYAADALAAAAKKSQDAWDAANGIIRTSWHTLASEMEKGFSELGTAIGGTFGKIASAATSAFKSATEGVASLSSGLFAFSHGDILGGISGVASGVMGIASAAVTAGKAIGGLIGNLFGLGSKGRDAVVAFADSFGGFDALHVKLNALGDAGEQLWIKLTQGVGKNDPAAAQAAIKAVTDALNAQQSASQDTQVQTEAQAAATVETATEASNALDTVTEKLKSNADDWKTWGDAVNGVINAVGAAVIAMPTPSAPGGVPGFATGTGGKYLNFGSGTLAMLHGNERVMTQGEGANGGGGGTAIIQLEARTLAEIIVPEMPGVIRRYGLA
jgi:predicted transcriptional regulator/plasmid maintenance system antidote protein VapI